MDKLGLEHQSQKITADRAHVRHPIFWAENYLRGQSENFTIDWGADHSRYVIMAGNEGTGNHDVEAWFAPPFGYPPVQ